METIEVTGENAVHQYLELSRRCGPLQQPTNGFASIAAGLVGGHFRYLTKHYDQRVFLLRRDGRNIAAAIGFIAKDKSLRSSLGGLLALDEVSPAEVHGFLDDVIALLALYEVFFPINGHINFGMSVPFPGENSSQITFMTTSRMKALDAIFTYPRASIDRTFLALTTELSEDLIKKLKSEIAKPPPSLSTRPLSHLHFKRDIQLHNDLVNATMSRLAYFQPLDGEDWYDLMRGARPLISPELSQFLCLDGKEIGFCFAFLDFNQVIGHLPDWLKAAKIVFARSGINRARIYSSGLLPEYRGRGLFKYVRNKVLLSLARRRVRMVESSYVDSVNAASLGNVRSKGALVSHRFATFRATRA